MNVDTVYAVWLQQALGYAYPKYDQIVQRYETARIFNKSGEQEWESCGLFNQAELNALKRTSGEDAVAIRKKCRESGIDIVTMWDSDYPSMLRHIHNPPIVLYYKGTLPKDDELCIAIVGTRKCTSSGEQTTRKISKELALRGVTVVSGGAIGIDSAAHRGALLGNGKGICVLGCGINIKYLMQNKKLRDAISQNGAVISEYPPDCPAFRYSFPQRNRIMSGLCSGVLVVEAGEKSGALITANLALEQNRDVFAVPGDVTKEASKGTNKLIKLGAIPVTEAEDIISQYEGSDERFIFKSAEQTSVPPENDTLQNTANEKIVKKAINIDELDATDEAKNVYKLLMQKSMHIDEICDETKLPVFEVNSALTELEMHGLTKTSAGRLYSIKN